MKRAASGVCQSAGGTENLWERAAREVCRVGCLSERGGTENLWELAACEACCVGCLSERGGYGELVGAGGP